MLLPKGEKIDRSLGARAYLRYPISAKKLINRISRLLPAPEDDVLQVGDVVLNVTQRCVLQGNRESHLTPRQARLLEVLMRHPGEILTRAFLMKQVWDTDYLGDTRTLDVHVHWVRKAIEEDPSSPFHLRTVRQVGYRFEAREKE
jgi:DNA-binding response OmpR family regulator